MEKEYTRHQINEISQWEIVKRQYFFKLKAHANLFAIMLLLTIVTTFLFIGEGSYGMSLNNIITIEISPVESSSTFIIIMIAIFVMAFQLCRVHHKKIMLPIISNYRTNNFANILLLLTLSGIAVVPAFLMSFTKRFFYFVFKDDHYAIFLEKITVSDLFVGILVTFLYMLLIASIGYLIGELLYVNIILLPIIFVAFIFILVPIKEVQLLVSIYTFFFEESNLFLFTAKTITSIVCFFLLAMIVGNWKGDKLT